MIMECTDCIHCLNFDDGFRVVCFNEELEPAAVIHYYPVGKIDAENCPGFEEGYEFEHYLTSKDLRDAEDFMGYEMDWYEGIVTWFKRRET